MRAVAIAVFGTDSRIDRSIRIYIARSHPTAELLVRAADSRIDDIRRHPGPSGRIRIAIAQWSRALINAIESPRRRGLRGGHGYGLVTLNAKHIGVIAQASHIGEREVGSKAIDRVGPLGAHSSTA